jgi:hypothetical protein
MLHIKKVFAKLFSKSLRNSKPRNSNMNKSRLGGRDSRGKFETKLQKA